MANNDFTKQIFEDIADYQDKFECEIENISKDEWAFNFWVLDKIYHEDEELINSKIIDYHDMGIDAFEIYEDLCEIHLLQNKFYGTDKSSKVTLPYIENKLIANGVQSLINGTYHHCEELQRMFTKLSKDKDFKLFIDIYVTNDKKDADIDKYIKKYNKEHPNIIISYYGLSDIEYKYYNHSIGNTVKVKYKLKTINKGTVLNYTADYGIENEIDAKYVLSPVSCIYRMLKSAKEKGYELFDSNIREYLGATTGVNKKIYDTLNDKEERKNFFYYNNGITIIGDKTKRITSGPADGLSFEVENPQIVNGCQTVNSIFKVLDNFNEDTIDNEFGNSFVMVKVLEIDKSSPILTTLYKNIVKYNNSQNSIKEDAFVKKQEIFNRLKLEFENKGFLLLVKASDKNTYKEEYNGKLSLLNKRNQDYLNRFGFNAPKTLKDLYIDIDKLMQVVLAFKAGGHAAYTKKSELFKTETDSYKTVLDFIMSNEVTMQTLLDLYLLFKKAESTKRKGERHPIPYYLIDFFGRYECEKRPNMISKKLDNSTSVDKIIKLYTAVTMAYMKEIGLDYNVLIKKPIDYNIIEKHRYVYQGVLN